MSVDTDYGLTSCTATAAAARSWGCSTKQSRADNNSREHSSTHSAGN